MSMDDRFDIWDAARMLAQAGTEGAMATVARQRGSCPMASDAKMVVALDGRQWGTIGGGCLEAGVIEAANEVAHRGEPRFVSHTLTAEAAGDLGLSCGGTAELFLEPIVVSKEMADLYAGVAAAICDRVPLVVYTGMSWDAGPEKAVRYSPAGVGGRGIETELVMVGDFEIPDSAADLLRGQATNAYYEEELVLAEPLPRNPRLVIFGAGHVGAEIAKAARAVGFHVVLYDDREEFANRERVPWAHEIRVQDFRTLWDTLNIDEDDYLLTATRGHSFDALVLEHVAESPARYVGMLGSRRKRAVMFRALEAAGVPGAALARVKTPVGLYIGADTPAEIAVSVVAELVRVRRTGTLET